MREPTKTAFYFRKDGESIGFLLPEDRQLLRHYFAPYELPSASVLTGKRCWLYSRVDQCKGDTEQALQMQDHALRRFAEEKGMVIAGATAEEAAGRPLDRNGLNKVLQAAREGQADFILTRSRDRIFRSTDLRDLFRYELQLNNYGVKVVYSSEIA